MSILISEVFNDTHRPVARVLFAGVIVREAECTFDRLELKEDMEKVAFLELYGLTYLEF